ncbi:lipase family protein [Listeria booriae]|uniref:Lipase family protein n=1 Tax=Listeria booriae TaxID=1552123 RepID=A0A842FWR1_9LIST|nr:Mbeg1-like protein [Listeria booriae]MBC2285758.1 lipase family protein [Listeria booriae]
MTKEKYTHKEYNWLDQAVYSDEVLYKERLIYDPSNLKVAKWEVKDFINNDGKNGRNNSGLQSIVVEDVKDFKTNKNSSTVELTIAYRGTQPDKFADLVTDVNIHTGSIQGALKNSQFDQADKQLKLLKEKYEKQGKKIVVHVTGHSLGGAISSYVAYKNPDTVKSAMTFSAPNVYSMMSPDIQKQIRDGFFKDRMQNIANKHDIIGRMNEKAPYGGRQTIIDNKLMGALGFLGAHDIKSFVFNNSGSVDTEPIKITPHLIKKAIGQYRQVASMYEEKLKAQTKIANDLEDAERRVKHEFMAKVGTEYRGITQGEVEQIFVYTTQGNGTFFNRAASNDFQKEFKKAIDEANNFASALEHALSQMNETDHLLSRVSYIN